MYNAEEKLSLLDSFFRDLEIHSALRASLFKSSIIQLSKSEALSTRRTQISAGEHWAGGRRMSGAYVSLFLNSYVWV
jgi:hypothetical protein